MTPRFAPLRYHHASKHHRDELLEVVGAKVLDVAATRDFSVRDRLLPSTFSQLPKYKYASLSTRHRSPVMTIDIDETWQHDRIEQLAFRPNFIGINAQKGTSQIIFYLQSEVFGEGRPRQYLNAIGRGLTEMLDGDPHFTHGMARNPFDASGEYEWHYQNSERRSLADLHQLVVPDGGPLPLKQSAGPRHPGKIVDATGKLMRKTYLFDVARTRGYELRRQGQVVEYAAIRRVIDSAHREIIAIDERGPVEQHVLHNTARSVVRFCNRPAGSSTGSEVPMFTAEQCSRGGQVGGKTQGMRNVESGSLERARAASGIVISATSTMLAAEIRLLHETGLSKAEIARQLGCDKRTVYRAFAQEW